MDCRFTPILAVCLCFTGAVGGKDYSTATPEGYASLSAQGLDGTTGGRDGAVHAIRSLAELKQHATAKAPAILQIYGQIKGPPGERIRLSSNKTIVGIGSDAAILGPELHLIDVSNIIIANLTIGDSYDAATYENGKGPDYDGIQADGCHHLWIDHCCFRKTNDGLIDLRKGCDCVTISWCVFTDHNKAIGVGWTDATDFRVTMHHNWIHHTNQRNPGFDNGVCHLYNNWFQSITACGPHARGRARLLVENCLFEDVRNPLRRDPSATLVGRGNIFKDCTGDQHGQPGHLDVGYDYQLTPVEKLKSLLQHQSGPQTRPATP